MVSVPVFSAAITMNTQHEKRIRTQKHTKNARTFPAFSHKCGVFRVLVIGEQNNLQCNAEVHIQ